MDVFFLLIDVPKQRPARPLGANKRIFTAYGVEITTPQQQVVLILSDERQHLHGQGIAHMQRAGLQIAHAEPALDIAEHPPFRDQQMRR
ncbi:hypothetical protein D3C71_1067720 [compost metagenome]